MNKAAPVFCNSSENDVPVLRWKAYLSNGEVIYEDNLNYNSQSTWRRIKEYLSDNNLNIIRLELGSKGNYGISIGLDDKIECWWHSKRLGRFLGHAGGHFLGKSVGFLAGKVLYIWWMDEEGNIWKEEREVDPKSIVEKPSFIEIR